MPTMGGTMQSIHKHGHCNWQSSVAFLSMIGMDPSNLTCVDSTFYRKRLASVRVQTMAIASACVRALLKLRKVIKHRAYVS